MTDQERRAYIKAHLSSMYGMMVTKELTKEQQKAIRKAYRKGASKAVYTDTDSVVIDGRDKTFCVYDHAKELLK